ncbi:MAG: M1 family metallopeptidase [Thermanaerothrix sp.]|uniref:M1 family metallopeptidase n=1 Tax=Thermanaerothrix sp. TaxID=2972675 RepID=UPI003C7E0A4B
MLRPWRAIRNSILVFGLSLSIVACQLNNDALVPSTSIETETQSSLTVTSTSQSTIAMTETPTGGATLTPALASSGNEGLPNYFLWLRLFPERHTVEVEERIRWFNDTGAPREELPLVVEAARYPKGFEWLSVMQGERSLTIEPETVNVWKIKEMSPVTEGETTELTLHYRLNLPEIPPPSDTAKPQIYGYTLRQINLVDWYPYIPSFKDGEWLVHPPGYFGEHQVYPLSDYEVVLEILDSSREWLIAASAAGEKDSEGRYQFGLQRARNFVLSLSPDYQINETTVNNIRVVSYYFKDNTLAGEAALKATAQALELYSKLFSPYSRAQLSLVEADFLDGMEYDGLYFLSKGFYNLYDGTPQGYLTMIAAHETAHQWWYGQVANDQALHPWLDEALCTYSERLFYENYYPDLVAWWWFYRVNYYQPAGWIDRSIYDYAGYQAYRNAVYLRGAQFFEDLRQAIGDEAFFTALREYAQQYNGRIASPLDLLNLLRGQTKSDLEPLLRQYFSSFASQ